ncbi:cysteine hydrolase [Oscillochloris sp. ZM17-4]|uniref:cysteine hydrolase family protein n=1 Tax=Oscillochloris sp. ZM17-4 TaxID=2866714 RepID=UPI001C734111|nr:isochorismatase family cysteine hydrolase [Oscillochloris sp. ZM17-4]MBX0326117.1 cysteine hydrolase [Oscillochloris sp. ZM17-4]
MTRSLNLTATAAPFLSYLDRWYTSLPSADLASIVGDTPDRVAVLSIDMINGFCKQGPLSGPRVGALIPAVVDIFTRAHSLGVRSLVLTQDTHDPNTPEFGFYPPHCIAGTPESQAVSELAELPFADQITTIEKNSLSSHLGTSLGSWLAAHPQVDTFIIVGDCTDLCVFSAAMHLRLEANALNLQRRVIVPAAAVDTFDTPVDLAQSLGIMAHDGDLHHALFLHTMAQNGVEVVATV